jgi:hypothetical protein
MGKGVPFFNKKKEAIMPAVKEVVKGGESTITTQEKLKEIKPFLKKPHSSSIFLATTKLPDRVLITPQPLSLIVSHIFRNFPLLFHKFYDYINNNYIFI